MYPQEDLMAFARQKAGLRRSIAMNRGRCADAAASAARPIEFVDSVRAYWRQLSPVVRMAAVPLGVVVTRAIFPRYRILRTLLRWAPLALAAARAVSAGKTGGIARSSPASSGRPSESAAS